MTFIKENMIGDVRIRVPGKEWNRYHDINNLRLQVKSTVTIEVCMDGDRRSINFGVMSESTMSVPLLLGRDVLKLSLNEKKKKEV